MARGGARPGAGGAARKSATPSPVSARARARAREVAGNQRPWPADKVERWAIDRLIPYAKNARTHTDAQVAAIAASIKEWGWTTPVLVSAGCRKCDDTIYDPRLYGLDEIYGGFAWRPRKGCVGGIERGETSTV